MAYRLPQSDWTTLNEAAASIYEAAPELGADGITDVIMEAFAAGKLETKVGTFSPFALELARAACIPCRMNWETGWVTISRALLPQDTERWRPLVRYSQIEALFLDPPKVSKAKTGPSPVASERVRQFLLTNPERLSDTLDAVVAEIKTAGIQAERTTVASVLRNLRTELRTTPNSK